MADPGADSKRWLPWLLLGAAILAAGAVWLGRRPPAQAPVAAASASASSSTSAKPLRMLTVGVLLDGASDLIHLAAAQGYFAAEGLEVKARRFKNGRKALDTLGAGAVDLTAVGDVPMAVEAFTHPDYAIFATIGHARNRILVVGRKDKGFNAMADLKGKRLGLEPDFSSGYILSRLLQSHGLQSADVKVVELKGPQLPGALQRGEVEAIADCHLNKHRFLDRAVKALGVDAVDLIEPSGYRLAVNTVATRAFIARNPEVLRGFVRALLRAGDFARDHRDDAQHAVAGLLAVEGKKVAADWARFSFEVTLDPTLLTALDDESRWYLRSGHAGADARPPVYASLLYPDALRAERPAAVTLAP